MKKTIFISLGLCSAFASIVLSTVSIIINDTGYHLELKFEYIQEA